MNDWYLWLLIKQVNQLIPTVLGKLIFYISVNQKFCNILVYASLQEVYHMTKAVQTVVGSIVVIGALI